MTWLSPKLNPKLAYFFIGLQQVQPQYKLQTVKSLFVRVKMAHRALSPRLKNAPLKDRKSPVSDVIADIWFDTDTLPLPTLGVAIIGS